MEFLNNLFTGKDNKTADIGRVGFVIALVGYLIVVMYDAYVNKHFDAQGTGVSLGAILGGGMGGLGMKKGAEPE
jgi:hypothetical protein